MIKNCHEFDVFLLSNTLSTGLQWPKKFGTILYAISLPYID